MKARNFYNPVCSVLLFLMGLSFVSCKKDKKTPLPLPKAEMEYIDLTGKEIGPNGSVTLDLNHDGKNDLRFHTLLVGDPIAKQDKLQFYALSLVESFFPVNAIEGIPVMNKGETIPTGNFSDFTWYEISSIVLAQKITGLTPPSFWEGSWKNANHKYLPVQVKVNQQRYNGWVELSMDIQAEKIVLHKAAISKQPESDIKAGI